MCCFNCVATSMILYTKFTLSFNRIVLFSFDGYDWNYSKSMSDLCLESRPTIKFDIETEIN